MATFLLPLKDDSSFRKSFEITRETFEELCQDLFEKTIECVREAIKLSNCKMASDLENFLEKIISKYIPTSSK